MTRRERLERKLEKREEWATKREAEGHRRFERACEEAKPFENGQPILIGHHSEKKARAAQKRVDDNMRASVENSQMADYHRSKAAGLADQLEASIYDDDPDAVERIEEKIAELERHQEFMRSVNKICRNQKLDEAGKIAAIVELGASAETVEKILHPEYTWKVVGFESCTMTNNSASIRRYKKRLATVKAARKLKDRAEEAEAGVVIDRIYNGRMFRVTFAEKPERSVINALKSAGYRWSKVCWVGDADKLPPEVLKMSQAEAEKC